MSTPPTSPPAPAAAAPTPATTPARGTGANAKRHLRNYLLGARFRIKRLVNDVAGGHLKVPEYPLRDGDELKDVFDAVTAMVRGLRERQEADAAAVGTMIERAARSKAAMELVPELQELEAKI